MTSPGGYRSCSKRYSNPFFYTLRVFLRNRSNMGQTVVHKIQGSSVLVLSTDKTSTFVLFEYALRAFIPAGWI